MSGPVRKARARRPEPERTDVAAASVTASGAPSHAETAAARLFAKIAENAEHLDSLRSVAHQAQVREAVTRQELGQALETALAGRAAIQRAWRAEAFRRYLAAARIGRLRRRSRPVRLAERLLARLDWPGETLVIALSGVWSGTHGLSGLRRMAAYARRRTDPCVQPSALFDQTWYLSRYPDVGAGRVSPLIHYLLRGGLEDRSPHPLLDAAWYRSRNAHELAATGLTPLEHFLRVGAARGRDPHPLFDTAHYVAQASDIGPGDNVLSHYLNEGWKQGLSPHPLFDPAWYAAEAKGTDGAPLVHYLMTGWRDGLSPHPLFDPAWYLSHNPDVAEAGHEPLTHFVAAGGREGRSPSPYFDVPYYVAVRGAALAEGVNPLVDYLQGGAWTAAGTRPGFPAMAYLAATPELARDGMTPLEHWVRGRRDQVAPRGSASATDRP